MNQNPNHINDLKNKIVDNQHLLDQLNADLARKTQEVKIIQEISSEINLTLDLDVVLQKMLQSLDKTFEFKHSMVLLVKEEEKSLQVAASYGYDDDGIGAIVEFGKGIIGVVAKRKKLMRMGNIGMQMAYMNAVKTQFNNDSNNVPLPGLKNVQSQVAIPLLHNDDLIGVLVVESNQPNLFDTKDELIVSILANQAASAIVKAKAHQDLIELNASLEDKVKARTEEVVRKNEELELKNLEITDSIRYAKRIQDTLLPSDNYLKENFPDSFIYFKPKDIVSGDFYWVNKKEDNLLFAAMDCTGHGVPGAFVSIVGHGGLQRSVTIFELRKTNEILDKLNENVITNFELNDLKDGMDLALCNLNRENKTIQFTGANNPLYVIRNSNNELETISDSSPVIKSIQTNGLTIFEVKPDKQPIGRYLHHKPFSAHTFQLEKGDVIYIFSDGYADQFGGPKGKKFKYSQFKDLLAEISPKPMMEQKDILHKTHLEWKGNQEQVDDICIIGVRV